MHRCNKQHVYVYKQFAVVLLLIYLCNMKQIPVYRYTPVAACWLMDLIEDTEMSVRVPVRCSLQWELQRNVKKNAIQNQFVVVRNVYNTSR